MSKHSEHVTQREKQIFVVSMAKTIHEQYTMVVRQEPSLARICGNVDIEKRTLDPPPVIEVLSIDCNGLLHKITEHRRFLVVRVELWDNLAKTRITSSARVSTENTLLEGCLIQSGRPLRDENGQVCLMFPFPFISIRCTGIFTLRFSLYNLSYEDRYIDC